MSIATALTALADDVSAAKAAITAKGGAAPIGTADMAAAIAAIPSGGITPSGSLDITANGTYDVTQYAEAEVNVPIPEGYVIPSGSVNINTNGTHDVGGKKSAIVNVPTGAARTSADLTASGATVNVPAGLYSEAASKSVASGTQGTPTASKSAVSGNSITVTPSCTDTTGYISGTTKTGTGVTVSASELVSGNKAISANGTGIDVTNYKTVSVDVPAPSTQSKSATPSLSAQTISPDSGKLLSSVSVAAITKELLASLDADFVAENIKKDVELFGLIGALEGGGGGGDILGHKFVAGSFTLAADTTSNYTIMSAADLFEALKDDFPGATSILSNVYRTNGSDHGSVYLFFGGICWMDIDSADTYVDSSHPKMVIATFLPPPKFRSSSNAMLYCDNYGQATGRRQTMLNLDNTGAVMRFTSSYMGYAGAKYNYLFYVNNHGAVQ